MLKAPARKLLPSAPTLTHHPTQPNPTPHMLPAECLHDLLETSARMLRLGGRLAYFVPAAPGYYSEEELPRHPALEVGGWVCVAGGAG